MFQYVRDCLLSAFIQKSFKAVFHAQFLTFLIIQINSMFTNAIAIEYA